MNKDLANRVEGLPTITLHLPNEGDSGESNLVLHSVNAQPPPRWYSEAPPASSESMAVPARRPSVLTGLVQRVARAISMLASCMRPASRASPAEPPAAISDQRKRSAPIPAQPAPRIAAQARRPQLPAPRRE